MNSIKEQISNDENRIEVKVNCCPMMEEVK